MKINNKSLKKKRCVLLLTVFHFFEDIQARFSVKTIFLILIFPDFYVQLLLFEILLHQSLLFLYQRCKKFGQLTIEGPEVAALESILVPLFTWLGVTISRWVSSSPKLE